MLLPHGSGKTAVLVERMIQKIIKDKIDIDSILIVTFTNAAASEMKERILEAIYKKIEENPEDSHLQRQITLLNKANISTIHSFCLEVIKNNFFEIDISPNFRIGESSEIELLKMDVLDELFEEKYNSGDKEFLELVETYSSYRGDDELRELILDIYKFIQSSPFPNEWFEEAVDKFNIDSNINFEETIWGKILINNYFEFIEETKTNLENVVGMIDTNYELEKYSKIVKLDIENLEQLKTNNWDEMIKKLENFKFKTWPTDKKITSNIKDSAYERRKNINKKFNDQKKEMIKYTSKEAVEDIIFTYNYLRILKNIVIEFSERFSQKKKEKNIIDFNDIEHFALKILVKKDEKGNYIPTDVAKSYMKKFTEIAIDEYQDSNLVQEYILSKISTGKNVFMVGDVKQSIYKFRQARPELFLEKYNSYKLKENKAEEDSLKIQLFKNFRSRDTVLNLTNIIFEEIMSKELGNIEYNENEYLNLGASYPERNDAKAECYLINLKDEEQNEWDMYEENEEEEETEENSEPVEKNMIESKFVANKIQELIENKFQVYDIKQKQYRNIKYKDIVILLRATSNVAPIYEKTLAEANIPVYSDSSSEYLESTEIQTIMATLKIINNPMQDIPFVAVLRSIIGGFTDNELVEIRLVDRHCNFYECIQKAILQVNNSLRAKIENFLTKIEKWREEQEYLSLDELIWKIYEETSYYEYVGLMKNGSLRQANLKMLFEKAKAYENASFTGLFNFINFIEKIKTSSGDLDAAKIIGENEDVVRIMSIHKSKGLEFPVVFLCNSSKQFNMNDLKNSILLDHDLGIGPQYIDYRKRIEYNTLAKEAIKLKIKNENISEEMRVLYVALTRAKEKLYITGTSRDAEEEIKEKENTVEIFKNKKISKLTMQRYLSYMHWIEYVYLKNKETMKEFFEFNIINKNEILENEDLQEENEKLSKVINEKLKYVKMLDKEYLEKINWKYKNEELTKIASKMSVSEIKKNKIKNELQQEIIMQSPKFIAEEKVSASRKGTLVHLCMQKLDFRKEYTYSSIKEMIAELENKKIITSLEAENINIEKILNFTKSKIYKELKTAKIVEKEKPFYINIPSNKIYGGKTTTPILVQGIIDLYYINKENELVLLDYKTDYVENKNENTLKEKYKIQLELYKKSLEEALNRRVDKIYIYSTYLDKEIKI